MKTTGTKSFLVRNSWWLLAILILFLYRRTYSFDNMLATNLALTAIDVVVILCCSLILVRFLIPYLLYRKRTWLFMLSLLLLVVGFAYAMQFLQWCWYKAYKSLDPDIMDVFGQLTYQVFNSHMVVFFGSLCVTAVKLLGDQWRSQTQYLELQKEKAQTELGFLKAQINPHFLFNSINSIFAHIDKGNQSAREMVLKFSDMLRYQLYDCNEDRIGIEKEIAYLHNYVELQRLRKETHLKIDFDVLGEMQGFEIAPLLLIPFIENAFKYAATDETNENIIRIILAKYPGSFQFYCLNRKDIVRSRQIAKDNGIGIRNVMRRLDLIYPGQYELVIRDENTSFEVTLNIQLS